MLVGKGRLMTCSPCKERVVFEKVVNACALQMLVMNDVASWLRPSFPSVAARTIRPEMSLSRKEVREAFHRRFLPMNPVLPPHEKGLCLEPTEWVSRC